MTAAIVVLAALLAVVLLLSAYATRISRRRNAAGSHGSLLRFFLTVGMILALVRISALWFLVYHVWARQGSVSQLPLVVLLFPDGLLLPNRFAWTVWGTALFSIVLLIGSFAWAGALTAGAAAIVYARGR